MSDDLVGGPRERQRRTPSRHARLWRAGAAVVVAGAAAAIVAPQLSLHADRPPAGSAPHRDSASGQPAGVAARWPLRGNLAHDDGFVAAGIRRLNQQRPDVSLPLFAGRLPDGSRLLLAASGADQGGVALPVSALHIAARQTFVTGTYSGVSALTDPTQVLAWAGVGRDGQALAVVLGPRRPIRLELSPRVRFSAAGATSRTWRTIASDDGVVVAELGSRSDQSVAARSVGSSPTYVAPILIPVEGRAPTVPDLLEVGGIEGPGYRGPRPELLRQALYADTQALLDLGRSTQRVIWSGVPWGQRRFAMVLITRADGRRFQALVGEQGGTPFPAGLRPLGVADRADLPWVLEPFTSQDPTLLICPSGGGGSLVYRHGDRHTTLPVRADGVVGLVEPGPLPPATGGAHVALHARNGRLLLRTVLPDVRSNDPFGLGPGQ